MGKVGIIANPAASKDIRRLVAQGRVIPDWEKVNIVRRVLIGLQAVGIEQVVAMPDSSHLCERARDDSHLTLDLSLLEMPTYYTEGDTVRAAAQMAREGVTCLVTLGGDGTNRAVACGCNSIPIVPISTGTNNVFPQMVEGTLAGLAAGVVADGRLQSEWVSTVSKTLAVYVDGDYRDMALVDVALSRERYVATRAIWDMSTLYEVFLTRAEPASIGLSSVGARLQRLSLNDAGALRYVLASAANQPEGEERTRASQGLKRRCERRGICTGAHSPGDGNRSRYSAVGTACRGGASGPWTKACRRGPGRRTSIYGYAPSACGNIGPAKRAACSASGTGPAGSFRTGPVQELRQIRWHQGTGRVKGGEDK